MLDRLEELEREQAEIEARLADPELAADSSRYVEVTRRYAELRDIVAVGAELRSAHETAELARLLYAEADGDEREQLRAEIDAAEAQIVEQEERLRILLLPKDPNEGRTVIVEIRGAEGGEEANLFARDLFEMYRSWSQAMGWRFEMLGSHVSDLGGFADVTFSVAGDGAWTRLKFEAGPHRVQRVPVTESQGRIHTSSATVAVLPEADEIEVDIDPNDLQIDTYRSSGAGGQSVNTTDSAVRILHRPTGIMVTMQDEKSQLQNRQRAMTVLRARLLAAEQDRARAESSAQRREQVGGGGRSEKIRTYNFKENRVTDHRIGLTIHKLDRVLAGDLSEVSDALVHDERTAQLQAETGGEV